MNCVFEYQATSEKCRDIVVCIHKNWQTTIAVIGEDKVLHFVQGNSRVFCVTDDLRQLLDTTRGATCAENR